MSTFEKLVGKIVSKPDKVTSNDCFRLFEFLGFTKKKKPGSEIVFHRKGSIAFPVPTPKKGKYVKIEYIKRFIQLLELEDYLENYKED